MEGRGELLADIRGRLTAPGGPQSRMVVLHGLGGVGKTSVALHYAHTRQGDYGLIWQLPAEDITTLSAALGELAVQLGVRDLGDGVDPVRQLHAVLAARSDRWLLLFDNATDPASVQSMVPLIGNGHVLITTRNGHWPAANSLLVPPLDPADATAFLLRRTGESEAESASRLAADLGCLPLALEQAAAYVGSTGRSLAEYARRFHTQKQVLLSKGQPLDYGATVATTWSLAFAQLQATAPGAINMLRFLACFGPDRIPYELLLTQGDIGTDSGDVAQLLEVLPRTEVAIDDAVAELLALSLISRPNRGVTTVHRLVQAATRDLSIGADADVWHDLATRLLRSVLPTDPTQPSTWPQYALLLPHAQHILSADLPAMRELARYVGLSGDPRTAILLMTAILDADLETIGEEAVDTLTDRHSLIRWTAEAGDMAGAQDLFAALLTLREQVLGPEHPDTLSNLHDFASCTDGAGDSRTARDLFAKLLPVRQQVLGPEHRDTLNTRNSLAGCIGRAGEPAKARDMFAALLPIRERVLGPEHPGTLTTRSNLASWTGDAGEPAKARDMLSVLLPVMERVLGPEHPDTLTTLNNFASRTGEAGDPTKARNMLAALLPIRERVLGPEHPDTLTTHNNLANWTGDAGEPGRARDMLSALLPVVERVLGPEHPYTLTTLNNLASRTGIAGEPAKARDMYAALVPVVERVFGPEHPNTRKTRDNLAFWCLGRAERRRQTRRPSRR
ncbi:FxSxx-COOH system tetratricopeptide repeat protein [Longispora urticae]